MSDSTKVTLRVAAPRDLAFAVFVSEVDSWWRHGKRYRIGKESRMVLEPQLGGKFCEVVTRAQKSETYVMGEVLVWEPAQRLVFTWRAVNYTPSDPSSEVEVTFERAIGHSGEGTLVTLVHRGFAALRADHPVRHGQDGRAFVASLERWWGDLLAVYRDLCVQKANESPY